MTAGRTQLRRVLRAALAVGAAVLVAAALLLAPVIWFALQDPFGGAPHPSDAAMLAQFREKRTALEEMVGMIGHDPALQRLAPDFTRPDDPARFGISPERIAEYRRLCRDAGISLGFTRHGDAVEFTVHGRGLAISGSGKGFAYRDAPDPEGDVIEGDLDAAAAGLVDKNVLLQRKIDGKWWLQLDMR